MRLVARKDKSTMANVAFWLSVLLLVSGIESNVDGQGFSSVKLLYYQLFTPLKLVGSASFVHHQNLSTAEQLTFARPPSVNYRLLLVPLIPRGLIGPGTTDVVIKMVVGTDKAIGQRPSDPSFVISDGTNFAGLLIRVPYNYTYGRSPCAIVEGTSGTNIGNRDYGPQPELPVPSMSYPGRFEIQLSLADRWGSCFIPMGEGISRETTYRKRLDPHNGLFLEVYSSGYTFEGTSIKYIEVSILGKTVKTS